MKNVGSFRAALLTFAATAILATPAHASTCTPPVTGDLGDNFAMWDASGWQCQQVYINYWWSAFDFDQGDWDEGFGYEAPCDNARPLARTFNGLYTLGYSSTGSPSCNTNQGNITLWAQCWSASQIDELDGRCGSGQPYVGNAALTGTNPPDHWTELFWPFFYGMTVAVRASSIFHEARHASGCGHNGNPSCPRGSSCDFAWNNGCRQSSSPVQGANQFEVNYISWFLATAWRTTQAMKDNAQAQANAVLQRGFAYNPCILLSSNGSPYSSC